MIISEETARSAYEAFCTRRKDWVAPIGAPAEEGGQLGMYLAGARAFGGHGGLAEFTKVYNGLRKWKLFRGGQVKPTKWVFEKLACLDPGLRERRLSELDTNDWPRVCEAIWLLREVKDNATGPSVMAISKFLHFWNPRLFVICDQAEVEQFVFGHRWLKAEVDGMDVAHYGGNGEVAQEQRLVEYLRVLALASELVKANMHILMEFDRTVRCLVPGAAIPADIGTYEATAVEWCLVGLAEMPPAGVFL